MNETAILQKIRLKASRLGWKLSRNNSGAFQDVNGRWVKYGCFAPGGADLIGFRTITITPDMIGKKISQFIAIEVKTPTGKIKPEQQHFIDTVNNSGGVGIIARSEGDLVKD